MSTSEIDEILLSEMASVACDNYFSKQHLKRSLDFDKTSESNNSFSEDVIDSILQPGLNPRMYAVMNGTFVLLFLVLIFLAVLTGGDWNVILFLAMNVALFGAINWFLVEIQKQAKSN